MRARRAILSTSILLALGLLFLPASASANYAFQGMVSLSGGYDSNAGGVASNTPGGANDPDAVVIISPSVIFTSALPRAMQRLAYNFSAQLYASHPELTSLSNRLEWSGVFTPSKTTDLIVGANATQTQLNTLDISTLDTGNGVPTTITRPGTQTFWGAGLQESFFWAWSPLARLRQGATFTAFIPTTAGVGQSYNATARIGLERSFRHDMFFGDLQMGYTYYQEQRGPVLNSDGTVNADGVVVPLQQQIDGNLLVHWKRDFGYFWNTDLFAGVMMVMRATDGGGQIWQPAGGASANYVDPRFQFSVGYSHIASPNVLVHATFMSDIVSMRMAVPFGIKARLAFSASGTYTHSQVADANSGTVGGDINSFLVDAGLIWNPFAGINIFTRYSYLNQLGDETQTPSIPSLERHMLLIGITATYPTDPAAFVSLRRGVRVDQSDANAIPNLHSQPSP